MAELEELVEIYTEAGHVLHRIKTGQAVPLESVQMLAHYLRNHIEAFEVGMRMKNISRMAWSMPADSYAFHVATPDGVGANGPSLLVALRRVQGDSDG